MLDTYDSATLKVLSQKHAEGKRGRRIHRVFFDKMHSCVGRACRGKEPAVTCFSVYVKDQLVRLRLINLFNLSHIYFFVQLPHYGTGHDSVKCHFFSPNILSVYKYNIFQVVFSTEIVYNQRAIIRKRK